MGHESGAAGIIPLDISEAGGYNQNIKGRCDKRLAPYRFVFIRNRHLPGWRFLLFTVIVIVYVNT